MFLNYDKGHLSLHRYLLKAVTFYIYMTEYESVLWIYFHVHLLYRFFSLWDRTQDFMHAREVLCY